MGLAKRGESSRLRYEAKVEQNRSIVFSWFGAGLFVVAGILTPLVAVVSQQNTAMATDALVARWKFDETTAGVTAKDDIGSNDGAPGKQAGVYPTPSTDVPPVSFPDTGSMNFNGQNYFTINNPVSTNFTICAWVKTSSTGGGVNHWTSAPIMDAEWGGVNYDFGFGVGNGGKLMFGNGGDDVDYGYLYDAQVNGATTINDDAWHNVCATRNNTTGLVNLYVDARLDGSGTTGIGSLTVRGSARIGWGYDGAALYQGLIDDVRVYGTDLSQEQLQNLADGSDSPNAPPDDNDGIAAAVEDAAPNGGDANNDGTLDSEQPNVTSLVSTVNGSYVTLALDASCAVTAANTQGVSSTEDEGYTYPYGMAGFTVNCGTAGYTTTVQQYYFGATGHDLVARKYNSTTHTYGTIPGATITDVTIGGQAAKLLSYQVTDGGPLDSDGSANGVIVDPAGLATVTIPGAPNTGLPRKDMTPLVVILLCSLAIGIIAAIWASRRVVR